MLNTVLENFVLLRVKFVKCELDPNSLTPNRVTPSNR